MTRTENASSRVLVCNEEKCFIYINEGKTALIDYNKPGRFINNYAQNLNIVKRIFKPNSIVKVEALSVIGYETIDGVDVVIVKQMPTDYTFNRYSITSYIASKYGGLSLKTIYTDSYTDSVVRILEYSQIEEIAPGIWRPMNIVETNYRYVENSKEPVFDFQYEVEIKSIDEVNKLLAEDTFSINLPKDTVKFTDLTVGDSSSTPVEIELRGGLIGDLLGIEGVCSIMEALDKSEQNCNSDKANTASKEDDITANSRNATLSLPDSTSPHLIAEGKQHYIVILTAIIVIIIALLLLIKFKSKKLGSNS